MAAVTPEIVANSLEQAARELIAIGEENYSDALGIHSMLVAGFICKAITDLTGRSPKEQIERFGYTYLGIADGNLEAIEVNLN